MCAECGASGHQSGRSGPFDRGTPIVSERVTVALQRKQCFSFPEKIMDSRGAGTCPGLTFVTVRKTAWDLSFESRVNLNIHVPFHP